MNLIALFFAGAFLCNCVPHFCSAVMGQPFPSPFAKPPGVGDSPPIVNLLWGFLNLLIGIVLLLTHPVATALSPGFASLMAGVLVMGVQLSLHFGKVRRNRPAK